MPNILSIERAREALTEREQARLQKCEAVIEGGMTAFVEVGNALAEIRDAKLYRRDFDTFDNYLAERWGFRRAHAYRLINAAETMETLSPVGDKMPVCETQVRPLLRLPEQDRAEAWKEAVETSAGKQPTQKRVEEVVRAKLGEDKSTPERGSEGKPNVKTRATSAMQMVRIAISQMERIRSDDPERDKAFTFLETWINEHADTNSTREWKSKRIGRRSADKINEVLSELEAVLFRPAMQVSYVAARKHAGDLRRQITMLLK